MINKCSLIVSVLLMSFVSFAQKKYELSINVNNTIEKEKLSFLIDADQSNISVQNEGENRVKVTGELIEEAIPLTIMYNQAASIFILTDRPAIISLTYSDNKYFIYEVAKLNNNYIS